MTLAEYLEKNKLSDEDFAQRIGAHRTEIWNYRTGRRMPKADKVAAIEEATGGEVRAKDFISDAA